jgi:hypothetical protein
VLQCYSQCSSPISPLLLQWGGSPQRFRLQRQTKGPSNPDRDSLIGSMLPGDLPIEATRLQGWQYSGRSSLLQATHSRTTPVSSSYPCSGVSLLPLAHEGSWEVKPGSRLCVSNSHSSLRPGVLCLAPSAPYGLVSRRCPPRHQQWELGRSLYER